MVGTEKLISSGVIMFLMDATMISIPTKIIVMAIIIVVIRSIVFL